MTETGIPGDQSPGDHRQDVIDIISGDELPESPGTPPPEETPGPAPPALPGDESTAFLLFLILILLILAF
ncbi:MAG: hypothetical protein IMX00_07105 [Limnochordales bacterium]|nr:hypothetical protein [Limnochordales bacterium]